MCTVYFSGLGVYTLLSWGGAVLRHDVLAIAGYGSLVCLLLIPAGYYFNRKVYKERIETLFPLDASPSQLNQTEKLFIAGLLHRQYKQMNQHIYAVLKQMKANGETRVYRELSYLYNRRDLSRHLCNKLTQDSHLNRSDLDVLNLMFSTKPPVSFEVVHLSRLQAEYRDRPKEKMEKISELNRLGYQFLEGFGYIKALDDHWAGERTALRERKGGI